MRVCVVSAGDVELPVEDDGAGVEARPLHPRQSHPVPHPLQTVMILYHDTFYSNYISQYQFRCLLHQLGGNLGGAVVDRLWPPRFRYPAGGKGFGARYSTNLLHIREIWLQDRFPPRQTPIL